MQDDEVWRRAFADNSGLFDNTSFGPLFGDIFPTGEPSSSVSGGAGGGAGGGGGNTGTLSRRVNTGAASFTSPQGSLPTGTFSAGQAPLTKNVTIYPNPASDLVAPAPASRQPLPPSAARFAAGSACTTSVESTPSLSERGTRTSGRTSSPFLALSVQDVSSAKGLANPGAERSLANEEGASALVPDPAEEDHGGTNQRGGESFVRKRDRAKLLRQQMNDGLDSLHEALVEISSSGADPSAAATTSLIPTRGPRRATVVAYSSELVRDLIKVCVGLRRENAELTKRLASAAVRDVGGMANPEAKPTIKNASLSSSSSSSLAAPLSDGAEQSGPASSNEKRETVTALGEGDGASKVFGQLLALGVFSFLGPRSLDEGRRVCREWRDKCTWDCCWSNLCAKRWRLGPEQRHAEVWRANESAAMISPPVPPPSWRQIYGNLHGHRTCPTGALSPAHLVVGTTIKQGVAIWIALSRRSNGMTGRSVLGPGSSGVRTTEVVELRAVVQRVDEGPAIQVHPRSCTVRQIVGVESADSGDGATSFSSSSPSPVLATVRTFPSLAESEARFMPRVTVNTGADKRKHTPDGGAALFGALCGDAPALSSVTPKPLALYEYATVDFFVEVAGCSTELKFLELETCVDVSVSEVGQAAKLVSVVSTIGARSAAPYYRDHAAGEGCHRRTKQRR